MPKSSAHHERRQHQRTPVTSGVIAVLITSSPEIIGSVKDISLSGARVTYHDPQSRGLDFSELKVDLISDERFVEAIPCRNVWDMDVADGDFTPVGDLRQCGIEFVDPTPNQLFLLRSFINRCAALENKASSSPEVAATPDQ